MSLTEAKLCLAAIEPAAAARIGGAMIVGILSDTHDRLPAMQGAIAVLKLARAEFFVHCGDVGGQRIIDEFAGLKAAFVWGNNDFDRPILAKYARSLGVQCLDSFGRLELGGKLFAVTHGDDPRLVKRILAEQRDDYLLVGHSHMRSDRRDGRVRVIN